MHCDFCKSKHQPFDAFCPECGFPVNGTPEQKAEFEAKHEELKHAIDSAETALSWARFGLLWPWLGALTITAVYELRPPMNISRFLYEAVGCGIFIACYFLVTWKPVPILLLALMLLFIITLFSLLVLHLSITISLLPAILMLAYGNALYSVWKAESELEKKKESLRISHQN